MRNAGRCEGTAEPRRFSIGCRKRNLRNEGNMTEESQLITELDLELLLKKDQDTCNRLAESLERMAAERLGNEVKKSRPRKFKYYFRKGKETKETQHDWDDDFKSAVGLGIARGFDA